MQCKAFIAEQTSDTFMLQQSGLLQHRLFRCKPICAWCVLRFQHSDTRCTLDYMRQTSSHLISRIAQWSEKLQRKHQKRRAYSGQKHPYTLDSLYNIASFLWLFHQ